MDSKPVARPKRNVILYGHSIGAGVACFAAANNPHPHLKIRGIVWKLPLLPSPTCFALSTRTNGFRIIT